MEGLTPTVRRRANRPNLDGRCSPA
jgi:hypothetical protein